MRLYFANDFYIPLLTKKNKNKVLDLLDRIMQKVQLKKNPYLSFRRSVKGRFVTW